MGVGEGEEAKEFEETKGEKVGRET